MTLNHYDIFLTFQERASLTFKHSGKHLVADSEWFIPDPDPALDFPCSGSRSNPYNLIIFGNYFVRNNNSGSGSRQKFRIHADPDPQHCFFLRFPTFTILPNLLKVSESGYKILEWGYRDTGLGFFSALLLFGWESLLYNMVFYYLTNCQIVVKKYLFFSPPPGLGTFTVS